MQGRGRRRGCLGEKPRRLDLEGHTAGQAMGFLSVRKRVKHCCMWPAHKNLPCWNAELTHDYHNTAVPCNVVVEDGLKLDRIALLVIP